MINTIGRYEKCYFRASLLPMIKSLKNCHGDHSGGGTQKRTPSNMYLFSIIAKNLFAGF